MTTATETRAGEESLFQNYRRIPVSFARGEGIRLFDTEGREYLDFLAGIATSSLGHAHPRLVAALCEQVGKYLHVSNLFRIPEQERAAARLVAAAHQADAPAQAQLDRVFFCNSGAEANEAAIKLARKWGSTQPGPDGPRFEILSTLGGFHGRTLGALAATGTPAYHAGFEPLPAGFVHVPYNDLAAVEAALTERTCAVLVEPVQGEAGVFPATPEYLLGLQGLARERGILLILDEVQTGIGRTGSMFGFQHYGVCPDVICLAKGVGGGVPVGVVLARTEVAQLLVPGTHGTTFGGNALASTAVLTVADVVSQPDFLANVVARGAQLRAGLDRLQREGLLVAVRSLGLMLGCDLEDEAAPVIDACLAHGLVIGAAGAKRIRLLPPLVLTEEDVKLALERLEGALRTTVGKR